MQNSQICFPGLWIQYSCKSGRLSSQFFFTRFRESIWLNMLNCLSVIYGRVNWQGLWLNFICEQNDLLFVCMSELSSSQWVHHNTDASSSHGHWSVENGFWARLCHHCYAESIRWSWWGILLLYETTVFIFVLSYLCCTVSFVNRYNVLAYAMRCVWWWCIMAVAKSLNRSSWFWCEGWCRGLPLYIRWGLDLPFERETYLWM